MIPTQAELDQVCVQRLIQFIRGQDLGDEDGDTNLTELRASALGDIFHSSPQVVDPPVDQFLCDKAIPTQCVRTLYAQDLGVPATPMATNSVARCGAAASNISAYDEYLHLNRRREKVVIVGANDGMLHAFLDSKATEVQSGGLCTITYAPPLPWGTGNSGGGGELWVFIPPDQLSRLQDLVLGHQFPDLPYRRPAWEKAADIARQLHRRGILTKVLNSPGQDVDGGCGQLRARSIAGEAPIRVVKRQTG